MAVDSARKSDVLATWITTEHNEGENAGPWVIKQSAEFGGRLTDFTGNQGTWDTFVNLGTGPRLLEYTLDLHSPDHKGFLFDDLLVQQLRLRRRSQQPEPGARAEGKNLQLQRQLQARSEHLRL